MPIFYYQAKAKDGKTKSGTLDAKDEHSLAQTLRQKGLVLISAHSLEQVPTEVGKKIDLLTKLKGFLGRVPLLEKLVFTRHLTVMIGAGFSLHKALETLARQTPNQTFKKAINDIVICIKKGETLADSLARYPKIFNNFYINMVKVGEKSGKLEEVLRILAEYLKKEHDFRSKVKGAMIYPSVIILTMIGIGILMMVVVMPKITDMFKELDVDLPLTTQILMVVSSFLAKYILIVIIISIILIFILFKMAKTKKGKYVISWFFLNSPFVKELTKKINCARFARSFSALMESGVPIVESLHITAQTVDNVFYSNSLIGVASEIKGGKKFQESLEKYSKIYPLLVSQMVGVGEETGELSDIIKRLADFYEEEVKNITDNLASVIEPVLMIIIGVVVGFFAVSMIQPMYSMMSGL